MCLKVFGISVNVKRSWLGFIEYTTATYLPRLICIIKSVNVCWWGCRFCFLCTFPYTYYITSGILCFFFVCFMSYNIGGVNSRGQCTIFFVGVGGEIRGGWITERPCLFCGFVRNSQRERESSMPMIMMMITQTTCPLISYRDIYGLCNVIL